MQRRDFLTGVAGAAICWGRGPGIHLIAHRGGVVDNGRPENSAAAISAAIEHGYWMIEVDVDAQRMANPSSITIPRCSATTETLAGLKS